MASKKRKHKNASRENANHHHLCWPRRAWKGGAVKLLREYDYCKVLIPINELHRKIHFRLRGIPVPKESNASAALEQLKFLREQGVIRPNDPIEKRLTLLILLFDYCDQRTADAFREQLRIVQASKKAPN